MARTIPGRPAAILLTLALASHALGEGAYDLTYSTYFGGSGWEHARDVFVDAAGNTYVCGGTASRDFPTTPGAYDQTFNFGDTSGDECDAFICKFGPNGQLIWSTYLGSPGYDRAYGIEVDGQGYVYVAGRAGRGFPTTPGAFQPTFQGYNGGGYGGYPERIRGQAVPGWLDALWASYVGVAQLCRDIAIDASGDIYLPLGYPDKGASASRRVVRQCISEDARGRHGLRSNQGFPRRRQSPVGHLAGRLG